MSVQPVAKEAEHKGIPQAVFLTDLTAEAKKSGGTRNLLTALNNMYGKYKYLEGNQLKQKKSLIKKQADIIKSRGGIEYLIEKRDANESTECNFELSDALFVKADIPSGDSVMIWMGANVMLEYTLDEAKSFLDENLKRTKYRLETLNKDLDYLKEQITVQEVNITRVHNLDVAQRKARDANK